MWNEELEEELMPHRAESVHSRTMYSMWGKGCVFVSNLCAVTLALPQELFKRWKIKWNQMPQWIKCKEYILIDRIVYLIAQQHNIKWFPSQESHYSRHSSKKQCLSQDLSVKKMFVLLKEAHPNVACKLHLYRDVFRSSFNLRFGFPRSDTCQKCDSYYVKLLNAADET